jgi:hypothetical protein
VTVAIGSRGEGVVSWGSGRGTGALAWRTAGGRWLSPTFITNLVLQVALDRRGNAFALGYGHGNELRVAFKRARRAWRRPVRIGTANGVVPQLVLDARGDAIAVWSQTLSHRRGELVKSAFRPAGGSWRRPATIGRPQELSGVPHIAVDPSGDAIVAWATYGRFNHCCATAVQAVIKPVGGRWRRPVTIAHNQRTGDVQVAFGRHGNATAVWSTYKGHASRGTVQSASRPAGGSWKAPVTIASAAWGFDSLRLALDPRGDALAAWKVITAPPSPSYVQTAMATPQGGWEPPVKLGGGPSTISQGLPATGAALDSQGNANVIWLHDLGNDQQAVEAATFTRAG